MVNVMGIVQHKQQAAPAMTNYLLRFLLCFFTDLRLLDTLHMISFSL